jgi:CheY-like chemotaxis protein
MQAPQQSILIVDDNQHMRMIVATLLRGLGYARTLEAADGVQAFEMMRTIPVDAVVLDLRMDTLDGIDFVRLLRTARDSPNTEVAVIMMTGHSERSHVVAARDAGVNEFLVKPISARGLAERLASAIHAPRSFVRTRHFTGPDRRRRSGAYPGDDRRKG